MKNNVLARTILTAHRYLERICDAIDRLVEANAVNSFYVTGTTFMENSIMVVADKLIELGERKKTLINLKVLIESALERLDEGSCSLLMEKYMEHGTAKEFAKSHDVSLRTYFRKLTGAESALMEKIAFLGYDERKLMEMLKGEKWILDIYERLEDNGSKDIEISSSFIKKIASSKSEKAEECV